MIFNTSLPLLSKSDLVQTITNFPSLTSLPRGPAGPSVPPWAWGLCPSPSGRPLPVGLPSLPVLSRPAPGIAPEVS